MHDGRGLIDQTRQQGPVTREGDLRDAQSAQPTLVDLHKMLCDGFNHCAEIADRLDALAHQLGAPTSASILAQPGKVETPDTPEGLVAELIERYRALHRQVHRIRSTVESIAERVG